MRELTSHGDNVVLDVVATGKQVRVHGFGFAQRDLVTTVISLPMFEKVVY